MQEVANPQIGARLLIYLDLEANGLTPDTIWCVVTRENGVSTVHTTRDTLCKALEGSVSVCGHNLIGYDLPVSKTSLGAFCGS